MEILWFLVGIQDMPGGIGLILYVFSIHRFSTNHLYFDQLPDVVTNKKSFNIPSLGNALDQSLADESKSPRPNKKVASL